MLMPHPEHVHRTVQHSWAPEEWGEDGLELDSGDWSEDDFDLDDVDGMYG